jgi:putative ABC transport system permease protein
VLAARVTLSASQYEEPEAAARFFRSALDALGSQPGIEDAALVTSLPLDGWAYGEMFRGDRQQNTGAQRPFAHAQLVTDAYFRTVGIPILRGRGFDPRDGLTGPPVAIVNETLATLAFGTPAVVGRTIYVGPAAQEQALHIVGVVRDVKVDSLAEPEQSRPELYAPYWSIPARQSALVVRTTGDPMAAAPLVRDAIRSVDRDQPVTRFMPLERVIENSVRASRFRALLMAVFAAAALVLAAVGIYGIRAYAVAERRQEIGVRMALGADRADILRLVVVGGIRMSAYGTLIGLTGAWAAGRALSSFLFATGAWDPVVFGGGALLLITVAALASYAPARRAMRVDPSSALRGE